MWSLLGYYCVYLPVGICINPKPDGNEKYSFALISERTTDVFAFETEEAMKRWVDVIQERLGRGMQLFVCCLLSLRYACFSVDHKHNNSISATPTEAGACLVDSAGQCNCHYN